MDHRSAEAPAVEAPRDPLPSGVHDRRSTPRVAIEVEVSFGSDSQFFAGLSGDISEGGLFIATYRAVPIGARLEVDLALPDGKVHVAGQVRWARPASDGTPPGIGLAFVDLSPDARASIERFCRARAPLYVDMDE